DVHDKASLPHGTLVEMGHDVGAPGNRGQREAAANGLAKRAYIGGDTIVGLGAAIGEAKARHHLIEDEDEAVLLAQLAQAFKKARLGRDQALKRLAEYAREPALVFGNEVPPPFAISEGVDQDLRSPALE